MDGESEKTARFCAALGRPVRVAYEAGPTGYGLARELTKRGVECVIAAPSKIPRAAGDRVKTDRRDAERLVRRLLAGQLNPVRAPGPEEEALRDLVRVPARPRVKQRSDAGDHERQSAAFMPDSPAPVLKTVLIPALLRHIGRHG